MPPKRSKRGTRARGAPTGVVPDQALRDQVIDLLRVGHAHVGFKDAVRDWPVALRGEKPPGQPFTGWRLLEHLRLAQWDIVEFTLSAAHVSPDWPAGYWPESDGPPDAAAWDRSVAQVEDDRDRMVRLVRAPTTDLFARIPHGSGQTVLREALLIADHNAYHVGELVLLRRLLGIWKRDR